MKNSAVVDAEARFSAYIRKHRAQGPEVFRLGDKTVVVIEPEDDDDLGRLLLSRNTAFKAMIDRSRQSLRAGQGIPSREFWRMVEASSSKPKAKRRTARTRRGRELGT